MQRRHWLKIGWLVVVVLGAPSAAYAQSACISIAGQMLNPADVYDTRHQCGTCPGQAQLPLLCGALNRLMVPYWSKPADLVPMPHRGLWGQPVDSRVSENTLAALKAALAAGYRAIEIDAALSGPDIQGNPQVFMGHYFSMAATNGDRTKSPKNYTPNQLRTFYMNRRDSTPAWEADNRLPLSKEVIAWARDNQVVLTVDPKIPGDAPANEYERIMAMVLDDAYDLGALANIAIKTTDNNAVTVSGIKAFLRRPYSSYEGKFLWSPISNKDVPISLNDILQTIKDWHGATSSSKQVLTYEIQMFSSHYVGALPFMADGKSWRNLISYVRGLTPLGKRSALWSVDPMSDKGTIGRLYDFKFIGNTPDDVRGNPFYNLQYDDARHVAVISDRPEVYRDLVVDPYQ